ncbi:hypothetical protein [Phenylobacterium aquaticum]|uniref:hypothetical protein n=1 Tax=Phenylobacterium aquaticum TaxID=1763816 RepID=UPI0026F07C9F|nr:hypothetical protein [Phenylobacterium aquaticum]
MGVPVPRIGLLLALLLTASGARAQTDLFGPDTLHGLADIRLTSGDGERGFLAGGFGKTGRTDNGLSLQDLALEWKPHLGFAVSAVVSADYQPQLTPRLDWNEAYLKLKAPPSRLGRVQGRFGLFYPPVSMEHEGVAWSDPDMLSASAINSWIGEEVKVTGVEASLTRSLGAHEVTATGGVFGWNDTAGTLLTFRGWALHGVRTGAHTEFALPPLSAFMTPRQDEDTYPVLELDGRPGYYGRLEWRPPAPVVLNATFYDNGGNRTAVRDHQWAWETRFLNLGARWDVSETVRLQAQALNGETLMGFKRKGEIWVDVGFRSAYLLLQKRVGEDMVSARLDAFEVNDRTLQAIDNNDETGWAAALAWRHRLSPHAALVTEALHVTSDRPSRAYGRVAPHQDQTVVQSALRLSF